MGKFPSGYVWGKEKKMSRTENLAIALKVEMIHEVPEGGAVLAYWLARDRLIRALEKFLKESGIPEE